MWYTVYTANINMDRGKLKNIVKSLQSLLDVLESEVYSDVDAYSTNENNSTYTQGRDDDDGYPD